MKPTIPVLLLLAACSQRAEEPVTNNVQQPAPEAQPTLVENMNTAPAIDSKSREAAIAVLRDYFAAIAEHRYADAWRLWSESGRASGISEATFAARFDAYRSYRGTVGAPGQMEGAAGSSYLDIAVDVTGQLKAGERFNRSGTMTLRRVNDVPGATPEQLQWRIYRSGVEPQDSAD
jgi:hypothetical protein